MLVCSEREKQNIGQCAQPKQVVRSVLIRNVFGGRKEYKKVQWN